MAVDVLDDELPPGLQASDLGEAKSAGGLHLISLYPSPIRLNRLNGYVVIITDGQPVDRYKWKAAKSGVETATLETTARGRVHWRPKEEGTYAVSVTVVRGAAETTLSLKQEVLDVEPNIEKLKRVDDRMVPGGNITALRRLYYDLWPYVVANSDTDDRPAKRLLGCMVYASTVFNGSESSAESLSRPVRRVGKGKFREMKSWRERHLLDGNRKMGVCRVDPKVAAHALGLLTLPDDTPYTARNLQRAYQTLTDEQKRGLANRLRFPKANIAVAAELFMKSILAWVSAGHGTLGPTDLTEVNVLKTYGTLFKLGAFELAARRERQGITTVLTDKFGTQCEQAYRLPVMTVLLDPSVEIAPLETQWSGNPTAQKHFYGFVHYAYLAPYYVAQHHISDLAAWTATNIVDFVFPPYSNTRALPIHKDLEGPLTEVVIAIQPLTVSLMGTFVPRMIGGTSSLSNHALGRAVDFDYPTNPQLRRSHLKALEKVLDLGELYGVAQNHTELVELNNAFMTWFDDVASGVLSPEPSISTVLYDQFAGWFALGGIMTLPEELVSAMQGFDFEWGGNWKYQRDSMHFDFIG